MTCSFPHSMSFSALPPSSRGGEQRHSPRKGGTHRRGRRGAHVTGCKRRGRTAGALQGAGAVSGGAEPLLLGSDRLDEEAGLARGELQARGGRGRRERERSAQAKNVGGIVSEVIRGSFSLAGAVITYPYEPSGSRQHTQYGQAEKARHAGGRGEGRGRRGKKSGRWEKLENPITPAWGEANVRANQAIDHRGIAH